MRRVTAILLMILALFACGSTLPAAGRAAEAYFPGKRVLYIDSYHAEYDSSVIQQRAIRKVLDPAGVAVEVVYLDEKRRGDAESLRAAAKLAMDRAASLRPDVIVAADDAASKYVVVPYLKNAPTPVVFLGVNWSVEKYGYPFRNVTGQVEVELIRELVAMLGEYARGKRIALLSGDTLTDRNAIGYYREHLGLTFSDVRMVTTFGAWKEAYLALQKKADIMIFRNNSGVTGWREDEARAFIAEKTSIPSGTVSSFAAPWVLLSLTKDNAEFGEWAGQTVLEILGGTPPSAIPMTTNRRGLLVLNMSLAKRLGIVFPMELIDKAAFVEEGQQ